MKRICTILIICIAACLSAFSQYFPLFSQYLTNGLVLNPAYTGSREVLSINLMYRNQMIGTKGAPVYETFSVHAPLRNANVGLGLLVYNEQIGPNINTNASVNYAYRVRLGRGRLALGIKAGVNYGQYNLSNVYLTDANDPTFSKNNNSLILPNGGAGVYYYSRRFFTGFSLPYILSYKQKKDHNGYEIVHDASSYNFLFTSGYLLNFSRNFKLKPTTLVKYYVNRQSQIDLNMHFILFNDLLWLGTAYRMGATDRSDAALAGMFEVQMNPQLRFGYSFEYAGQNSAFYSFTSHELSLRYEFSYKIKAANPRYF